VTDKIHLRYDLHGANLDGEMRHAQTVMRQLGITYQVATPQSICDQWWFWNCANVPDPLPSYLTPLGLDPMKCVGWGLSQEEAEAIAGGCP
jgi:hypothetical protein